MKLNIRSNRIIIWPILLLTLLCSCKKESVYSTSCIKCIKECNSFTIKRRISYDSFENPRFYIKPNAIRSVSLWSTGEDKSWFDSICNKYGDTHFNRIIYKQLNLNSPDGSRTIFLPNITSINIVSNKDYDSSHPAGASLNDVLWVECESVKDYIDLGYPEKFDIFGPTNKGRLSDFSDVDFILTKGIDVWFDPLPENVTVHLFEATITTDDGNVFVSTVGCDFENLNKTGSSEWYK